LPFLLQEGGEPQHGCRLSAAFVQRPVEALVMDPVTILEVIQMLHRGSGKKKGGLGMLGIKNLLALVGLVVVAFAVAGWYLGWYKVGEQADANGHPQFEIQVNSGQVAKDLNKAKQEVIDDLNKTKTAVTPASGQTAPLPPMPPPPASPPGDSWKMPPSKNVP
jgi:hypothetical protein